MKSNKRNGALRWAYVVFAMALALVSTVTPSQGQAEFSEWSLPVNLGAPINTGGTEVGPHISKNGLSLYHLRNFNVFVSQRANVDDAWGARQRVGTSINTTFNEASPSLSLDEHVLLFASDRPGGFGGFDLYVSRRHNRRDDLGWQLPVNLGDGVNTPANELQATLFEDDATGVITVHFTSNRPDGLGGDDIYASILQPDETFGPAVLVGELSTPSNDSTPCIRRDGLEMFLTSDRPGTLGGLDLWVSTRTTTADPWSAPINLGPPVNTVSMDAGSALSFHGTELYFSSNRPGGFEAATSIGSPARSSEGPSECSRSMPILFRPAVARFVTVVTASFGAVKLLAGVLQCGELQMSEISFKDLPLYSYDYDANYPPVATAFKAAIAAVDAVLVVTPEYNRSMPGGLKNSR